MSGSGGSDEGFSRGRKFSSEELHLLLIALLAHAPRHGYELIKLLDTRSNGFYTPSPGMVYPALTYLEDLRLASVETVGNRKRYSITAAGRAYVDENRERIEVLWAKLNFLAKKMGLVRRALAGEQEEAGMGNPPRAELKAAFHRLKMLLIEHRPTAPEEERRILAILERAAADIAALCQATPKETS
jgi:DNA-binding PadR family transcriptional regulator